jgi:hypothetical protein
VESESVARRSAVIDPIREISVDVTKRVIDKYCTIRQAHNLKVIGSNPIPATKLIPSTQLVGGIFFLSGIGQADAGNQMATADGNHSGQTPQRGEISL